MALIDLPSSPAESSAIGGGNGGSAPKILLGFVSVCSLVISILGQLGILGSEWPTEIALFDGIWLVTFAVSMYWRNGHIYLFSIVYIAAFSIFHLSYVLPLAVNAHAADETAAASAAEWDRIASSLELLALACFGLGATAATLFRGRVASDTGTEEIERQALATGFWAGKGLVYGTLAGLALLYLMAGNVLAYSRADIYAGIGDTRGLGFLYLVAPSGLVLLVCAAVSRLQKAVAYSLAIVGFVAIMFLGERSSALFPLAVGMVIWRKVGHRIRNGVLLAGVAGVLVAIPAVRELRALGAYADVRGADVTRTFRESRVQDVFVELGGTHLLLANVVMWVPAEDPFRNGSSYLVALKEFIPNIGSTRARSERETAASGSQKDGKWWNAMSPANWYIYKADKWMFENGGGAGFSAVAEAYVNFGSVGVAFVFCLIGYVLSRIDQIRLLERPAWLVASATICWPMVKLVRNEFETMVKPIGFIVITLLIWRIISLLCGSASRSS